MNRPEGNGDPWDPNMQAQLPSYAEAVSAGPPYPASAPNHPGPLPPVQPPYPTSAPNHPAPPGTSAQLPYPTRDPNHPIAPPIQQLPYATQQPLYPTQAPYPTQASHTQDFTDFSEPLSSYQTHRSFQNGIPVVTHPPTHIQHVVSAPRKKTSTGVIVGLIIAVIVIVGVVKLISARRY